MNSEFNGRPEQAARSEAQFWRSMEELLPIFEREGIRLNLEAHPDDFIERNTEAVDLVRAIDSPGVGYVFCAPHTYYLGDDIGGDDRRTRRPSWPRSTSPTCSTTGRRPGIRYIVNPPGSTARVHQHLDIGQGEVDFEALLRGPSRGRLRRHPHGCVFAWEERAVESSRFMFERIKAYLAGGSAPA